MNKPFKQIQEETDNNRFLQRSDISDEEESKHQLVERITGELAEAGIPAWIFAQLPMNDGFKPVIQYNTVNNICRDIETNENELLISEKEYNLLISGFIASFMHTFSYVHNNKLETAMSFIDWAMIYWNQNGYVKN